MVMAVMIIITDLPLQVYKTVAVNKASNKSDNNNNNNNIIIIIIIIINNNNKYAGLSASSLFVSIAIETLGHMNKAGHSFLGKNK